MLGDRLRVGALRAGPHQTGAALASEDVGERVDPGVRQLHPADLRVAFESVRERTGVLVREPDQTARLGRELCDRAARGLHGVDEGVVRTRSDRDRSGLGTLILRDGLSIDREHGTVLTGTRGTGFVGRHGFSTSSHPRADAIGTGGFSCRPEQTAGVGVPFDAAEA